MKISLLRLAAKPTIACVTAAIAFAAPCAAGAQVTGLGYRLSFAGAPGATMTYAPYIEYAELSTTVYSGASIGLGEGESDAGTISGAPGFLSLGFSASATFDADEGVPAYPDCTRAPPPTS
jgi:hypothetical protein